ncbi:cellulase family glycosylhydrolase [Adhaeribacter aerolatus]|uniref:cellulase family glycosylhydrolase n=1 Tax=Adhaeribacter aerolatus TaxID=670289 RepID=UPI001FE514B8|nr:cellulase family glycosylhydrolase [Adhaeribacter aerolatus]
MNISLSGWAQRPVWSKEQANAWYAKQPWLLGCNYTPFNAINQLEMWQAETFDLTTIDKELALAESLGFNTLRVFLHDQLWVQDAEGFKNRIGQFLNIAQKHKIRPMLVLFDSCWDPFPQLGKQHEPVQGLHNSGWVQGPGADVLKDPAKQAYLEGYVKGIVSHFKNDDRILVWDVWNEPDNTNNSSYKTFEPTNKVELVTRLLPQVFAWTFSAEPSQPVTCGIWHGDCSSPEKLNPLQKIMVENSDIISFHNYDDAQEFEKRVKWLQVFGRPLLCTEYMSRGNKSTFQGSLSVAKKYKVAAYNWGFVAGKTNTIYPWDSWQKPYPTEPELWFHDIYRPGGDPYRAEEVALIRELTQANAKNDKNQRAPLQTRTKKRQKAAAQH